MTVIKIAGRDAITYARAAGLTLSKYAEVEREGLTVSEAVAVAAEDPSLIYVEIDRAKIVALQREAASAGDITTHGICSEVLAGDLDRLDQLVDVLVAAHDADTDD
jgi:hypothetical protein